MVPGNGNVFPVVDSRFCCRVNLNLEMSLWIFLDFIGLLRNLVTSGKSSDYKANLIGSHSSLVSEDLI